MTARPVALCLRACAPPPERDGPADAGDGLLRRAIHGTTELADLLDASPAAVVTLALAPVVAGALPEETLAALRAHEARGALELCATGATDAWLPALGPGGVRAQAAVGCTEHRRRFARQPLGFWPRDSACPAGLWDDLWPLGVRWVLTAPAALALARPPLVDAAIAFHPRGVAAFAAQPLAALDEPPRPDGALLTLVGDVNEAAGALEHIAAGDLALVTPATVLRRAPRHPVAVPAALAGGDPAARGPYTGPTLAMLRHLRQLEAALRRALEGDRVSRRPASPPATSELLRRRALTQAAREALLAAAADWPLGGERGAARFAAHAARGLSLVTALRGAAPLDAAYLSEIEARDGGLFEDLDPAWFAA